MNNAKFYLLSSVVQVIFTIFTLSLYINVLNPSDFGEFALMQKYASIAVIASTLGAGMILPNAIMGKNKVQIGQYIFSLLVIVFICSILMSALSLGIFLALKHFQVISNWSIINLFIAILTIPFQAIWLVLIDLITISGAGKKYFLSIIFQVAISFISVTMCLYVLDLKSHALFIGYFFGNFATCILGIYLNKKLILCKFRRECLYDVARIGPWSILSDIFENTKLFIESNVLTITTSTHQLGLIDHAFKYSRAGVMINKAFNRALWPISLNEAKSYKINNFSKTSFYSRFGNILLVFVAITFTMFSKDIIKIIGKGKFDEAWLFSSIFFLEVLLFNLSSKMLAYLYCSNQGDKVAKANIASFVISFTITIILIKLFKSYGIALSGAVKVFTSNCCFYFYSNKCNSHFKWLDYGIIASILYYIVYLVAIWKYGNCLYYISLAFLLPLLTLIIKEYSFREIKSFLHI